MGGTLSNIGGALASAAQPQFSNATKVNSDPNGGTVGDLRQAGATDDQLDQLGINRATPAAAQSAAPGVQQAGQALAAPWQAPRGSGGGQIPVTPTPQNITMSDPSYLAQAMQNWDPKKFYGGK